MSDPKFQTPETLFIRLMEECAEVIQAVTKIERFGFFEYHPNDPTKEANVIKLQKEIRDLRAVIFEVEEVIEPLAASAIESQKLS